MDPSKSKMDDDKRKPKRSRSCVRAVTGVPDEDSYKCVDDSEEPNVCESEVPTSAQALDAADLLRAFLALTMTARMDSR
ncbi:unnamed protein product [Ixodes pacificus]